MSNYIKSMFPRMDLGQIRGFLSTGVESPAAERESYYLHLAQSSKAIYKRLRDLDPHEEHLDDAHADLSQALAAYEEVYMEIGMKAGAKLLHQLLIAEE